MTDYKLSDLTSFLALIRFLSPSVPSGDWTHLSLSNGTELKRWSFLLVTDDNVPGRSRVWSRSRPERQEDPGNP